MTSTGIREHRSNYKNWLNDVKTVLHTYDLKLSDFPKYNFHDDFQSGLNPVESVTIAREELSELD